MVVKYCRIKDVLVLVCSHKGHIITLGLQNFTGTF